MWRHRDRPVPRAVLAVVLAASAAWSYVLLDRTPTWHPGLRTAVLVVGLAVAVLLLAPVSWWKRTAVAVAAAGLLPGLPGPAAYAIDTAATRTTDRCPPPDRSLWEGRAALALVAAFPVDPVERAERPDPEDPADPEDLAVNRSPGRHRVASLPTAATPPAGCSTPAA